MSSAVGSQQKPPRQPRRSQKNAINASPSHISLTPEMISRQTKSDLDIPSEKNNTENSPKTPRRHRKRPGPQPKDHSETNLSSGEVRSRKTSSKRPQQPPKNASFSSPMPRIDSTPKSENRPKVFQLTPGKKNVTPSQAYAGPTFHASPAASSLPIPKFYSKSVPELNKGPTMQSMIEKEVLESSSSDQSDSSPTPAFAQHASERQIKEETPLDIFFRADREEKEKKRREAEAIDTATKQEDLASAGSQSSDEQGSPSLEKMRHHSRHATNSSNGLFSMEMEDKQPSYERKFSDLSLSTTNRYNQNTPTSSMTESPEQERQRKAKTDALKKFLLSQTSKSSMEPMLGKESREPFKHQSSSPGKPADLDIQTVSRPGSSSSPLHKQMAINTVRKMSISPRPTSNLRQGLSTSEIPDQSTITELPATPTPLRTRNSYHSVPLQNNHNFSWNGNNPRSGSNTPSKVTQKPSASESIRDTNPFKNMEDDLRRILKLDILQSDGATGVRS